MAEKDLSGGARAIAVRNSVSLGVFLAVAASSRVPPSVIEWAGRGITADAAGTRWVLEVGKPHLDGFTLADKLIRRGELEDQLVELWQAYGYGGIDAAAFEAGLAEIVEAIEEWSSGPMDPELDRRSQAHGRGSPFPLGPGVPVR
ncbi:hypothetical protein PV728_42685 [Streptomyces europaeiscabiei]|uniref:hypothetical protein n=1 Tax=Streptomyces TaxID=1883 RepID=UPI000A368872|nr:MULTISPECIES: hypothetical protein [Streptomyces]MDX3636807.1 hypothetical protein [Streptomyces europaeiscabiei]MDX3655032.1 hypothetical protein [Streptomyces europaeiscabiei]WUD37899.1 hypothetical protein OG858_45165 [Streptomyces europaeiscabiei]